MSLSCDVRSLSTALEMRLGFKSEIGDSYDFSETHGQWRWRQTTHRKQRKNKQTKWVEFFLTIRLMQDTYRLRQWHMCMIPPSIIIGVGVGQNGSLTKCILKPTRKRESNCYFPSPDPGTSICCLDMILLLFDFLQFDLLNCAKSNPASQVWILFNTGEGILPSLPRGPKIKTTKTPVQKSTRCKLLDLQQSCQSNTEWAVIFKKSSPWALESTAFSANALNRFRDTVSFCVQSESPG